MHNPPLQRVGWNESLTNKYQNLRLTSNLDMEGTEPPPKRKERRPKRSLIPSMWKTAPTPQSPTPLQVLAKNLQVVVKTLQEGVRDLQAVAGNVPAKRVSTRALTVAPIVIGQGTPLSPVQGVPDVTPMAMMQRLALGATSVSPSAARISVETAVPPTRTLCCAHSCSES